MLHTHLNIGCGKLHEKNTKDIRWVNIDKVEELKPDILLDMTKDKLPFASGTVDHITAKACLGQIESNKDFLFVMNELHRVLKPGSQIWIYLPHKDYAHAYLDPFNQRRFNKLSWEAFDRDSRPYIDHLSYYGFKPWKDVAVETNKSGFLSIWMTKP